ncbi:MAG: alpha-amylase family glycosyl hydrolase, partial [Cypionkella sp.]
MAQASVDPDELIFDLRRARSAPDLEPMLQALYGDHPSYATFRQDLDKALAEAWKARPADLKTLDLQRDLEPDWFQRADMAGYVFYLDRFAGNLLGVLDHLDYLQDLGITYVHFMPCLKPRPGDSDGGYSVIDYRSINPDYGSLAEFKAVANELRKRGMSLCIDLVLNHTAKEHAWAVAAAQGDAKAQAFYWMFDSPDLPDAYSKTLTEVFPDNAPGNFTWYPDFGKWVWTTFNEHQWDLNWSNPQVFLEITKIMLHL